MAAPLYNLRAFQLALLAARVLPRVVGQAIAPLIGFAIARRNPAAFEAIRQNLTKATRRSGVDLENLCADNVASFSRMLADYFYYSSRPARAAQRLLARWSGFEHLDAARAAGKGIILVTGHLGNWELGGVLLALRGFAVNVITLDEPTTSLTAWRDAYRRRLGIKTIPVGPGRDFAFVEMIQILRRGECLAMLVDRPYAGTGSPVQLFGHASEFSSAPALLAQHTGAAVIPAFVTRMRRGRYEAIALPPVPMRDKRDPEGGIAPNTQAVASAFESVIRLHPDQWYNYVPVFSASPEPPP
jgi:lauroyl/myristoyl acyltransferase